MKIGIFGGCFNPPHNMHKKIALDLLDKEYLDKVIYVPTGDNYRKKDLAPFIDRYNMLKLMTEDFVNLEVSDFEFKNTLIYTYQTLDYFKNKYQDNEIYFICGTDNLKELKSWFNYQYILKNYKLLVIKRNDDKIEDILKELIEYKNNIIITEIESKKISSTIIRDNINKQNYYKGIDSIIDSKVYQYIINKNLYNFM